jgi:hypothetical protein
MYDSIVCVKEINFSDFFFYLITHYYLKCTSYYFLLCMKVCKYASSDYIISQTIVLQQDCFSAPLPSGEVLPYLNTPHTKNMQMKVDRLFKDQIQNSGDRLFEIIELNVDEPIIFQRGKRKKHLLERINVSDKNEDKRKIMLVIPR